MQQLLPGIEAPNGILSYGGGRQTVAICCLILDGRLPRPDKIVFADTSYENPMTFDYLRDVTQPAMSAAGMKIEVVGHEWSTVRDIYAHNGDLLLPVFTGDGKLRPFCSGEWKRNAVDRYLRVKHGITGGVKWIGFSADEKRRLKDDPTRGNWTFRYPLNELGITSENCREIISAHGWPQPHRSSCWMCPNKRNDEWVYIRDNHQELFAKACEIDAETREIDQEAGKSGVWLHPGRKPLRQAVDEGEQQEIYARCETGMCFV